MSAPTINLATEAAPLSDTPLVLLRWMVETGRPGTILEIGTHRGGSAIALMSLVPGPEHFLVTVDPWGGKPYHGEASPLDWNDDAQREAMVNLSIAAARHGVNWHHLKMTSDEALSFMSGRTAWYGGVCRPYGFDTVFLDGEHWWTTMRSELIRILLKPTTVIFVDNVNHAQPEGDKPLKDRLLEYAASMDLQVETRSDHGDEMMRLAVGKS